MLNKLNHFALLSDKIHSMTIFFKIHKPAKHCILGAHFSNTNTLLSKRINLSISAGIILNNIILAEYLLWNWIVIIPNTTNCNFTWKPSQGSYFKYLFLSLCDLLINKFRMILFGNMDEVRHIAGEKSSGREGGLEPLQYCTSIYFIHFANNFSYVGSWGGWSLSWVIGRKVPWTDGQSITEMTNTYIHMHTHSQSPVHLSCMYLDFARNPVETNMNTERTYKLLDSNTAHTVPYYTRHAVDSFIASGLFWMDGWMDGWMNGSDTSLFWNLHELFCWLWVFEMRSTVWIQYWIMLVSNWKKKL